MALLLKRVLNHSIDRVFAALSDSTRRGLLERLSRGPASVSALAEPLGITLAAVSQHVQVLEEAGVVRTEKVGRVRTCRIEGAGLRVAERWLSERRLAVESRFDRLDAVLDGEVSSPRRSKKGRKS